MDQIKVNTNELRSESQNLNSSANEIGDNQNQLSRTNSSIGNAYDGQLRRAVEGITGDVQPRGTQLRNRSLDLGDELVSRAVRFENANEAGGSAMIVMSHQLNSFIESSPILKIFSTLKKSDLAKASLFWGMSGLGFGGIIGLITFFPTINSFLQKAKALPSGSVPIPTPVPTPTPDLRPTPSQPVPSEISYVGYASKVPADDNRNTLSEVPKPDSNSDVVALYTRGNGSSSSNCTWYAAAAITEAFGIPLNSGLYGKTGKFSSSLGNGAEWADHAQAAIDPNNPLHSTYKQYQPYISAVDNIPQSGTIFSTPGTKGNPAGHVMFVEEAKVVEIDGKKSWQIQVSEEIYGGTNGYPQAKQVNLPNQPDVKRWTREITLPIDSSGNADTTGKFIHFQNPDLKH